MKILRQFQKIRKSLTVLNIELITLFIFNRPDALSSRYESQTWLIPVSGPILPLPRPDLTNFSASMQNLLVNPI